MCIGLEIAFSHSLKVVWMNRPSKLVEENSFLTTVLLSNFYRGKYVYSVHSTWFTRTRWQGYFFPSIFFLLYFSLIFIRIENLFTYFRIIIVNAFLMNTRRCFDSPPLFLAPFPFIIKTNKQVLFNPAQHYPTHPPTHPPITY